MSKKIILLTMLFAVVCLSGCSSPQGVSPDEQRGSIDQMREDTLAELYQEKPELKKKIKNSAGYGVFSNVNINIIFVSAGDGYGVVHSNKADNDTYMKMGQVGVGLGLGVKDFRAVFVFRTKEAMDKFVTSGWEFGAHADAAAKSGEKGGSASGAVSVQDIEIYQFTKNGLALQATVAGTKYWKDNDLN